MGVAIKLEGGCGGETGPKVELPINLIPVPTVAEGNRGGVGVGNVIFRAFPM